MGDLRGVWKIVSFQDAQGIKWGGVNFVGAGGPDYQGRIKISDNTLTYRRECQRIAINAQIDDQGQLLESQIAKPAALPENCEPLNTLETGLIDLLTSGPMTERLDTPRLRVTHNERVLVLTKTDSIIEDNEL